MYISIIMNNRMSFVYIEPSERMYRLYEVH